MRTLILGGVRSGKSRHAADLARAHGCAVTLIATGTASCERVSFMVAGLPLKVKSPAGDTA